MYHLCFIHNPRDILMRRRSQHVHERRGGSFGERGRPELESIVVRMAGAVRNGRPSWRTEQGESDRTSLEAWSHQTTMSSIRCPESEERIR
ncbi:hypothetical protein V1477_020314 [Vespula maculifrons]|uniref:Uncharacterized protein n=1 Tax=Vespula maculifrons TaxID=7453 RepID=A0ABD2ALL1_VESMC